MNTEKKIGFIVPSSNLTIERVYRGMDRGLRGIASIHYTRITVKAVTMGSDDVNRFDPMQLRNAAGLLADGEVNCIVWNGTSGAWTGRGLKEEQDTCRYISDTYGVPASTATLAQLEVLKNYGIHSFSLVTPYTDEPSKQMAATYENEGYKVVTRKDLHKVRNIDIGESSMDEIRALIRAADRSDAECLVVGCTNFPAAFVVDEMEEELGKPIFDSVLVCLENGLRTTGAHVPLHGWGQMMRKDPVLEKLQKILEALRYTVDASRTTIRIDVPHLNIGVDDVYAESTAAGVAALKLDSSLNQRALATVQWMEREKRQLIQEDCQHHEVPAPEPLMGTYGVKAQMLSPFVVNGRIIGWISAHYVPTTRKWTAQNVEALSQATREAQELMQAGGWI